MIRPKLQTLLDLINTELAKTKEFAEKTKVAAQEVAKSAAASPSQSGDRAHSQGTADIVEEKLGRIVLLKTEIEECLEKAIPETVSSPCYIKLESASLGTLEYYLVQNPVLIDKVKLISTQSPLALELLGKRVGESTTFGKILEIG